MAFAETFKALSDPVRREILNLLKGGRLTAGEIAGQFDMTAATVSAMPGSMRSPNSMVLCRAL